MHHLMVFTSQSNKQPVIGAVLITELTVVYWYDFCAVHLWVDWGGGSAPCLRLWAMRIGTKKIVAGTES